MADEQVTATSEVHVVPGTENDEPRIGVYVCHCGHNIAGVVDVAKVVKEVKDMDNVVDAEHYMFMCSKTGVQMVQDAVKNKGVNRTVVASCSKTQHGKTFAKAISDPDSMGEQALKKHIHYQAKVREFCSWVTPKKNVAQATEKATKIVSAAIERARKLEAVITKKIPTTKAALVIGGGIAGLRATMDLAELGIPVTLVEKKSSIGGHMTQLYKTFPTNECPQCSISPLTNGVADHKLVDLMTYSTVKNVEGGLGNFEVTIETKPRYVHDNCTSCGECAANCPVEVPSEWDHGMSMRHAIHKLYPQAIPSTYVRDKKNCITCQTCVNICPVGAVDFSMKKTRKTINVGSIVVAVGYDEYDPSEIEAYHYGEEGYDDVMTQLQFERMLNPVSLTGSHILRPSDGKVPRHVVMIQCVGSRNEQVGNEYCTGVCCMFANKNAQMIRDLSPETKVTICYIDMRTPGLGYEEFYKQSQMMGIRFIRGRPSEIQRDPISGDLSVIVEDTLSMLSMDLPADMVVLSCAMVPPKGIGILGSKLHVLRSKEGFLKEFHIKMNPTKSSKDGIFLAGAIQGPKDITQSVAQAGSAAALAAAPLVRGYIEKEMVMPIIDQDKCMACGACVTICPLSALSIEGELLVVNEASCKACGMCMPVCPTGAIQVTNTREDELYDEIIGLTGGKIHV